MANEQNLRPIQKGQLSNEELKKRQRNGGIKSGKARREKKMFSQVYSGYLAKEHKIIINGQNKKESGQNLLDSVISKILANGDMASVMMIKEMREATESKPLDINMLLKDD